MSARSAQVASESVPESSMISTDYDDMDSVIIMATSSDEAEEDTLEFPSATLFILIEPTVTSASSSNSDDTATTEVLDQFPQDDSSNYDVTSILPPTNNSSKYESSSSSIQTSSISSFGKTSLTSITNPSQVSSSQAKTPAESNVKGPISSFASQSSMQNSRGIFTSQHTIGSINPTPVLSTLQPSNSHLTSAFTQLAHNSSAAFATVSPFTKPLFTESPTDTTTSHTDATTTTASGPTCPHNQIPTPCESVAGSPTPSQCIASNAICNDVEDCKMEAIITASGTGRDELGCRRGQ